MNTSSHRIADLPEDTGAPPAASMVPAAASAATQRSLPQLTSQLPTLQRLKDKLGDQAYLLNYVPIDQVKIDLVEPKGPWKPERIQVADITQDNYSRKVWACLSNKVQSDGSFEIKFCTEEASGGSSKCSMKEIQDNNAWSGIFSKAELSTKTPILIKVCFILKGAQLGAAAEFSTGFLDVVKRACRKFKALDERTDQQENEREDNDSSDGLFVAETTLHPVSGTSQTARKSQQQDPHDRLNVRFSAPPTELFGVNRRVADSTEGSAGTLKTAKTSAMRPTLSTNITACNNKAPLTEPRAIRYVNQTAQMSQVISPVQPRSAALSPSAQSNPQNTSSKAALMLPTVAPYVTPSSSNAITQCSGQDTPPSSTPTVRKHLPKPGMRRVRDSAQDLSKRGLLYYQSAQGRLHKAEHELGHMEADIQERQERFGHSCKRQVQEIDIKMQQRHDREKREMMDRQRAETCKAKQSLVEAKRKHREEIQMLIEKKNSKAQEVEHLGQECDSLLEDLSREDMMRALSRANRAPKRRWADAAGEEAK